VPSDGRPLAIRCEHDIRVAAPTATQQPGKDHMDWDGLYHFFFETYQGVGLSILICLLICVVAAYITEKRTRKKFRDRPKGEDDFDLFDDDADMYDEEGRLLDEDERKARREVEEAKRSAKKRHHRKKKDDGDK
jgi:hypothetical protein